MLNGVEWAISASAIAGLVLNSVECAISDDKRAGKMLDGENRLISDGYCGIGVQSCRMGN